MNKNILYAYDNIEQVISNKYDLTKEEKDKLKEIKKIINNILN